MSEIEYSMNNSSAFVISQSISVATKLDQSDEENFNIFHGLGRKICHEFSSHEIAKEVVDINESIFFLHSILMNHQNDDLKWPQNEHKESKFEKSIDSWIYFDVGSI